MKKLLYKIALWLAEKAYNFVFDFIDTDDDGKISKEELNEVQDRIKNMYTRIKLLAK